MKLSIYNFRHIHLIALFILWVFVILFNERIIPRSAARRCHWPSAGTNQTNLLIVSDPQLIDYHTYPGRNAALLALSKHITNNYLFKNYRSLVSNLAPEQVIFVGDYLDNGRLDFQDQVVGSNLENYAREYAIFQRVFVQAAPEIPIITNVPGNHDVGWENGVTPEALARFHANFGDTNVLMRLQNHDLILLDTLSLSNTANESIYGPPRRFLELLKDTKLQRPRILFTHVPLWKDDSSKCGPLRESDRFPITKGFQYQTVLSKELSTELLDKIQPDLVLSGDDHDYCEYSHGSVEEITVKSISMAMGIRRPAVQLLTLYDTGVHKESYETAICYLPKPYNEVVIYCATAFVTLVSLVLIILMKTSSMSLVMRKHNLYQKEQPVSYDRLSSYLHDAEEEVNLSSASDLRGSYTYYTSSISDNFNRRRSHKKCNYGLILKHALLLFLMVAPVYWCFVHQIVVV